MPDIFLSYNRDDQVIARRFAEGFELAGFSVWWDQTLNAGEDYDRVTEKALEDAKAVVVLWSKKSVDSRWVRAEATQADRNGTLVPAMIEACKRPIMFELKQTADLSNWTGDPADKTWQAFLASVRRLVGKGEPSRTAVLPNPDRPRRNIALRISIAAAVLLVAGAGLWTLSRKSSDQAMQVAPAAAAEVTLAVLPFVNVSSDPEQEYFSDGLTEEILNQLAQVKELRVTGRTSSFSFKGKNEDLRVIAEKLDVANLLEGSIRKDGQQLRISAQLIDGKDGVERWSRTYARELNTVFALQEEIARDVALALSITLDVGKSSRARGGTTNVEAYEKYLRGAESAGAQAAQLYREAVALDPAFAMAWYSLYRALPPLSIRESANGAAVLRQEYSQVRQRLIALLPEDGELTQRFRADEANDAHRWAESLEGTGKLLANAPTDVRANHNHASTLRFVGRYRDALPYLKRLVQIEPLVYGHSVQLERVLRMVGSRAEVEEEVARGRLLATKPPDSVALDIADMITLLGDPGLSTTEVKAGFRKILQGSGGRQLPSYVASVMENPDDAVAARATLRQAFADPANQSEGPLTNIARLAAFVGDTELAIEALRRNFVKPGPAWLVTIWDASIHSGLRTDPGFKHLLRELGIVDYWRASGNWGDFCNPVGNDDFECH